MNSTVPQAILLSFCLCMSPSLSYLSLLEIQILYLLCAQKPTLFKKAFIDTITPEIIISRSVGCIVVKCTKHKIHHFNHFKMHNPGASSTFSVAPPSSLCSPKTFSSSQKETSIPIRQSLPISVVPNT